MVFAFASKQTNNWKIFQPHLTSDNRVIIIENQLPRGTNIFHTTFPHDATQIINPFFNSMI